MLTILSLFDVSGVWASAFELFGCSVWQVDLKLGDDVRGWSAQSLLRQLEGIESIDGVIGAPPCTAFARSGARAWAAKDGDGRTQAAVELVRQHGTKLGAGGVVADGKQPPKCPVEVGGIKCLEEDTYVEREYRNGYHDYSLWEEGRDGIGYHRETISRSVRWGRVDTRYPYDAPPLPLDLVGAAIDAELKHRREVEDRIIAACPELEPLDLPGPLFRSRGVVRLGGDPRVRFNAAMAKRGPPT